MRAKQKSESLAPTEAISQQLLKLHAAAAAAANAAYYAAGAIKFAPPRPKLPEILIWRVTLTRGRGRCDHADRLLPASRDAATQDAHR